MPSLFKSIRSGYSFDLEAELDEEDMHIDRELEANDLSRWLPPVENDSETSSSDSFTSPCSLDFMGNCKKPGHNSQCNHSKYGKPMSTKQIMEIIRSEDEEDQNGGLVQKATILPDDFDKHFTKNGSLKVISARHYDAKNKCIKPRRGFLAATESDFFSSITKVDDGSGKLRFFFSGVLNGWPCLQCLELLKITCKSPLMRGSVMRGPVMRGKTHWESGSSLKPTYPKGSIEVTVKLRAPSWSGSGWSRDSPGYLLWYESPASRKVPRLLYGTNIIKTFEKERIISEKSSPRCQKVHMISHRYSVGDGESVKDKLTYHSLAFLEWDHGLYCTVVEVGFMNGLSGSSGRSNWVEDKNEKVTSFFKCMPPEMVAPWRSNRVEIRCTDVEAKTLEEFLAYMKKYTGKDERFMDVQHTFSHHVRLSFNSREHIGQYLINYVRRTRSYSEVSNNCQTFTADFCAFLAGKKDVQPFHIVNRIDYRNHAYHFLYDMRSKPS